jgi:glycosyltransferase involved in cell wall biosynthesis
LTATKLLAMTRRVSRWLVFAALCLPYVLACVTVALLARLRRSRSELCTRPDRLRIVLGSDPIKNNAYWARALRAAGYSAETFTSAYYSAINDRSDWDRLLDEEYRGLPSITRPFAAFIAALYKYDVFVVPFTGFFIGNSVLWRLQAPLFKLATAKVIAIPYGADSYAYRAIRSTALTHGLMMSYPLASRIQRRVTSRVEYWSDKADAVIPGFMFPDGFGRWDVFVPSSVFLDLDEWSASKKLSSAEGRTGPVVVGHAPNHRGFKGTEFLVAAVDQLKSEGLQIELRLIERVKNTDLRAIFQNEIDILVEQLVAPGVGMNGLEGMASGLPVVSNLEDETYAVPLRRWSYFSECPIASASPETIANVLRTLVTRPALRLELGAAGRSYVEKYHGLDSGAYLFNEVIEYVYGRRDSLINLYHPLVGIYSKRLPRIDHPLVNNRIIS